MQIPCARRLIDRLFYNTAAPPTRRTSPLVPACGRKDFAVSVAAQARSKIRSEALALYKGARRVSLWAVFVETTQSIDDEARYPTSRPLEAKDNDG